MMPFQIARSVRSLNRLRRIAQVLTRHGFGHVVARANLGRFMPLWMFSRPHAPPVHDAVPESIGRRLAQAFTELGPAFVKLGQMLSTRPDLLPPDVIKEFRKLQDEVPAFDTAEAMAIIAEDLGRRVAECFCSIQETPLASASISQVYRAISNKGEELCVKVRRPGIDEVLKLDMELLRWLAESLERFVPELRVYRPVMIVGELEQTIMRELDFINEAAVTERFHRAFSEDPGIRVPKVHWELTSSRVLTLQMLGGVNVEKILSEPPYETPPETEASAPDLPRSTVETGAPATDLPRSTVEAGLPPRRINRSLVAQRLADCFLKQAFEFGLFHADPHPGNILVEPVAHVGLIDFGQVGTITDEWKGELVVIVYAAVNREVDVIIDAFADMGAVGVDTDRRGLHRALQFLLDKYYGLPIKRFDLGVLLKEFTDVMRQHDIVLPRDLVLLIKSFSTVATVTARLDPELDLLSLLQPRLKEAVGQRFSAKSLARETALAGWDLLTVARQLPGQLRHGLRRLSAGGWRLDVRHQNIDRLISELDRSSNRLAFSIVIAAIIIGSSVVLRSEPDLHLFGFVRVQTVGLLGYVVAGVMGLGLAWAIFRSGRLH